MRKLAALVFPLSLVLDKGSIYLVHACGLWDGYAHLFVVPLIVSLGFYVASDPEQSFRLPQLTRDYDRVPRAHRVYMVALWAGLSLVGGLIMNAMAGGHHVIDAVGFWGTHPLAQALLFQGAMFKLAHNRPVLDDRAVGGAGYPGRAMAIVGALQGLSQLQYIDPHAWWTWTALGQVLRAMLVSALLLSSGRVVWGSLWPVLSAYTVNNALALYGGKPLGFHF